MNVYLKSALSIVAYLFMMTWAVCTLPFPAAASDYVANYERVPAVENRPPQVATWSRTPTVIVCEHARVTQIEVDKATKFWKNLGYRFFRTQFKHDPLNKCLSSAPVGYILIHLVTMGVKMEDTALAQTHFFVDNDTATIDWAVIYMRSTHRETVLEHELGHALGFLHFNKINHLMNQRWEMGGWDTDGLHSNQK